MEAEGGGGGGGRVGRGKVGEGAEEAAEPDWLGSRMDEEEVEERKEASEEVGEANDVAEGIEVISSAFFFLYFLLCSFSSSFSFSLFSIRRFSILCNNCSC